MRSSTNHERSWLPPGKLSKKLENLIKTMKIKEKIQKRMRKIVEDYEKFKKESKNNRRKCKISAKWWKLEIFLEKIFKKCAACHSIEKGGANKIGPALYGVVGSKVGHVSDYKYSKALATYGKQWSFEELNGFLTKPASYLKGTKMSYAGLRKETDRASVIKYLNQNSDNPIPLP